MGGSGEAEGMELFEAARDGNEGRVRELLSSDFVSNLVCWSHPQVSLLFQEGKEIVFYLFIYFSFPLLF